MDVVPYDFYDDYDTDNVYESVVDVYKVQSFLLKYFLFPLIAINFIGNIINIYIYTSEPFRKVSIGFLLLCLSITDILNTYSVLYAYISVNLKISKSIRRLLLYFYVVIPFLTPAISALVSVDRCISVLRPNLIPKLKSRLIQAIIVSFLVVIFLSINSVIFTQKIFTKLQSVSHKSYNNYHVAYTIYVYPYINIVLASTIPFLIMTITNIITVVNLKQSKKKANVKTSRNNETRFLITSIVLNILFLVFYLPRYIIEFYRIHYDVNQYTNRDYTDLNWLAKMVYTYDFYDYCSMIADYWKYLYSTIQFAIYLIINKVYRKIFMDKLIKPHKKFISIGLFTVISGTGLSFLIFYLATISKLKSKEFCMSSYQCAENMRCEYAKCICDYNTLFYNNNTCKLPSNSSTGKNAFEIIGSSKPEILLTELPESVLVNKLVGIKLIETVRLNDTLYNYVLDRYQQAFFVFDEYWMFKYMFKVAIPLGFGYGTMVVAGNHIYLTAGMIYKCDLYGNILNRYSDFDKSFFDEMFFNETEGLLHVQNTGMDNVNFFELFDLDLNRLFINYTLNGIKNEIHSLVKHRNKIYIGNYMDLLVYENRVLIKQIQADTLAITKMVIDDYDNVLYANGQTGINLITYNGTQLKDVFLADQSYDILRYIGFDLRNKLIIAFSDRVIVFD